MVHGCRNPACGEFRSSLCIAAAMCSIYVVIVVAVGVVIVVVVGVVIVVVVVGVVVVIVVATNKDNYYSHSYSHKITESVTNKNHLINNCSFINWAYQLY